MTITKALAAIHEDESGHYGPLPGALVAAIGAIMLGIGAANDTGWMAVVGGIAAGLGIIGAFLGNHIKVEYEFYKRLDALEKK